MTVKQNPYSTITEEILQLSELCTGNGRIDPALYAQYDVKRGLRDLSGKGVLTGLTEISEIVSSKTVNGESVSCEGQLFYRGINVEELVRGCLKRSHLAYEEASYLLIFGKLPTAKELEEYASQLSNYRTLPTNFVRDIIMKAPTNDMMNTLARSVLTLYGYDDNANDLSIPNVLRQCMQLTAIFPILSVYAYQAYNHYVLNQSFFIHPPLQEYSTAENILYCLREDRSFTPLEAQVLDIALLLHAEHGGGNNSSFTMHVVTSSGTDTYSAVAASLASLKGPRHGGANIMVVKMMDDIKRNIRDIKDDDEIEAYLRKLLSRQAFDRSGLIYGMGHAVYSLSDPRAKLLEGFVQKLSSAKGRNEDYDLYASVARLAPRVIAEERHIYKGVSPNVDFFSGFVYSMLDLPLELYTPIFAIARMGGGWSAHRIEELINAGKIIRPAYMSVCPRREYIPLEER